MKAGEKFVMRAALLLMVGVIGFAVYMELGSRSKAPEDRAAQMMEMNAPAAAMMMIPKGTTPASLPEPQSAGALALGKYCARCHDLPTPTMHSGEDWPAVLERMRGYIQARRGGMMGAVIMPPDSDWQLMKEYLTAHGQQAMDTTRLAALDTSEGRLFKANCSRCHAAPDPAQHTADEWPSVVERMKRNMLSAGKPVPDDETTKTIIAFLQRHSAVSSD